MTDELREAAEIAGTRAFPAHPHFRGTGAALYIAGYEAGKPKWIPVSERLPELKDMGGYQKDEVYTYSQMEDGTKWYAVGRFSLERQQFIANSYVVAWMPTPPYTEGE